MFLDYRSSVLVALGPGELRPRPPKYCKIFLMSLPSRYKSYFSWIFTYMNFYLLTTHSCLIQLYFCMICSFVVSSKVVWRFNGESFVKQSVKVVPSVKLLFLKFCYQKSGHQDVVYMEMETSCLTRTGLGIKNCFYSHRMFAGDVSLIRNRCDQWIL